MCAAIVRVLGGIWIGTVRSSHYSFRYHAASQKRRATVQRDVISFRGLQASMKSETQCEMKLKHLPASGSSASFQVPLNLTEVEIKYHSHSFLTFLGLQFCKINCKIN